MENEFWKDVPNYEGLYQVSNLGRVKSLANNKERKEKILKFSLDNYGYHALSLYKKNKPKRYCIHVLVAITFLGHEPCGYKLVIDHINNEPSDNRLENLQIVTHRHNIYKTQGKGTSKYKGVFWDSLSKKWMSKIRSNGKQLYLGRFNCELAASLAYQNKLKEILC